MSRFVVILIFVAVVNASPLVKDLKRATCNACHPIQEGKLNIHLVPHSHDDAGWLKSVDQYYFGTSPYSAYSNAGVQNIISSVVQALRMDTSRRYIQVETVFFWMWWQRQNDEIKQQVVDLINSGQLEIINGAYSMNDEAATNYQSIIDQFTWGFRIINDTLGECARPKFGWQIDPFGHSREHASILKQLGLQGLVIGRLDYRDKNRRIAEQNLDFLWKSSANLENPNLFTTMFPDFYVAENGFNFDIIYNSDPINDDKSSPYYNLDGKIIHFMDILEGYRPYFKTPNIMLPMGGDFTYQAAEINYLNTDRLIKGFEGSERYNVFYSTPSCYIQAVNAALEADSIELTVKEDDFFPYASDDYSFWTGYFTSRPTNKRNERIGNNILQAAKQLAAFSKVRGNDQDSSLVSLRQTMGILQHHDAITGTEQQLVSQDYMRLLTKSIKEAEASAGDIIGDLLTKGPNQVDLGLSTCLLANISICETTKNDKFIVAVYNPLSRVVDHYVRLPVDSQFYLVNGPDGEETIDILDSISSFDWVLEDQKPSPYEIVFQARNLPPLGVKLYYVEKVETANKSYKPFKIAAPADDLSFGTETNGFTIDSDTGKLTSATVNGKKLAISQDILYYEGTVDDNSNAERRSSGAYVFKTNVTEPFLINENAVDVKIVKGDLVDEVLQVFSEEVTQIIRVYKAENDGYVEFDWLVGNLDSPNNNSKEVITRFSVNNFDSNAIFYTDSNGRELIQRKLNSRSDYEYDATLEPVSGNYYPVTSKILIRDEAQNLEVALLNDRAQGGSSLSNGQLELMVHRRCYHDDSFGVDEALNETEYNRVGIHVRGQHYLFLGEIEPSSGKSAAASERDISHRKLYSPWVLVGDATSPNLNTFQKLQALVNTEYSALTSSLPENVKILTLEPWKGETLLLRLEHTLEIGEDAALSQPIEISLEGIFTSFYIADIVETTLGANQLIDDFENEEKLIWNKEVPSALPRLDPDHPLDVTLLPMQIRTFIVTPSVFKNAVVFDN